MGQMKLSVRPFVRGTLPMPLWLQGAAEFTQAAVLCALAVTLPLVGVWFADGFKDRSFDSLARMGGHAWLLIHGVPLQLRIAEGVSSAEAVVGTLSLVPLGLTLIPFFLAWRSGRRLARASYTDDLWQALLGALGAYAAIGAGMAFITATREVNASVPAAALIPLIPAGLGLIVGAYREAGSWARLIGVDAVDWVSRTSQHSRWAGSYVWSAVRSGVVAVTAAVGLAALLLSVDIALHWADITAVYEKLGAGIVGGAVLTVAQLGLMPNLVAWTLSWASGAGFVLGTGSSISPLDTTVGPLPALPVLAALPTGNLEFGYAALLIPVAGGVLAGWWFLREGENHFDEWLAIKVKARWFTLPASTLVLGAFVGAVAGLLTLALTWISRGSIGIGRLVEVGPNPLTTAVWIAAEVAAGVVVGYLVGPWLEREPRRVSTASDAPTAA